MKALLVGTLFVIIALGMRLYSNAPLLPGTDAYLYTGNIPSWFAIAISLALTILSYFFIRKIQKKLSLPGLAWVFCLSPFFLHTALFLTPASLAQPLVLAAILAYISNARMFAYLALFLLSWTGFPHALVATITLLLLKKKPWITLPALLLLAPQAQLVPSKGFLVDFGSPIGLGVFSIMLSIIGIVLLWKYKSKHYWWFFFTLLLVIFSSYEQRLVVYTSLLTVGLASTALEGIRRSKWELKEVKKLFIILLYCGLLFSAISYATLVGNLPPNKEIQESLVWLNANSKHNAIVFSHADNGFWVTSFAKRKALITRWQTDGQYKDVLQTHSLEQAILYFSRNSVTHIMITKDMIGTVWDNDDQGLLFLLNNKDVFSKIYENDYVKIYEFKGKR